MSKSPNPRPPIRKLLAEFELLSGSDIREIPKKPTAPSLDRRRASPRASQMIADARWRRPGEQAAWIGKASQLWAA